VILRRLDDALDVPDEEEARETVARMGIDVDALAARIHARIDALEADKAQRDAAAQAEVNVLDRQVDLEGQKPEDVRQPVDGSVKLRPMKMVKAMSFGAVALAIAAGVALWLRSRAPEPIADKPKPTHFSRGPSSNEPPPPASAGTAEPEGDAGPVRRPVPQ
jgi:hypothetical protein